MATRGLVEILVQSFLPEAAMPTAVFPVVLAKLYKGDSATAMRAVLSTAIVSLVTIPL